MTKKREVSFTEEELEQLTEMLKNNSLSEVARTFDLTDNIIKVERNKNEKLNKAILVGIDSRPHNFKSLQIRKFKKKKQGIDNEQKQKTQMHNHLEEIDAIANYRRLVEKRKKEENLKSLKEIDLI